MKESDLITDEGKRKLICFDWDKTISKIHVHNEAVEMKIIPKYLKGVISVYGQEIVEQQVEQYIDGAYKSFFDKYKELDTILKNPEATRQLFNTIIEKGIKIAITTFSQYPEIIVDILDMIKLEPKIIENIIIVFGLPKFNMVGKKVHIEYAKEYFNIKENDNITLVDDSALNIRYAKYNGVAGIDGKGLEFFKEINIQFNLGLKGELFFDQLGATLDLFAISLNEHGDKNSKLDLEAKLSGDDTRDDDNESYGG